jgi:hypothetical protein
MRPEDAFDVGQLEDALTHDEAVSKEQRLGVSSLLQRHMDECVDTDDQITKLDMEQWKAAKELSVSLLQQAKTTLTTLSKAIDPIIGVDEVAVRTLAGLLDTVRSLIVMANTVDGLSERVIARATSDKP